MAFYGRDVPDKVRTTADVEAVHLFQRSIFYGLNAASRSSPVDDFCLEDAGDHLGQRPVLTVLHLVNLGFDAGFCLPLGIAEEQAVAAPGTIVDKALPLAGQRSYLACSRTSRTKPPRVPRC